MFSRHFFLRVPRVDLWWRPILLCMGLIDELVAGMPIVALPLLRDRLDLSYAQVGLLFTVGAFSAMLLEPLINLFSDRQSKKPWILGGLLLLTVTEIVIGNTTSYTVLLLAFIVYWPAGGAATGLSQAALIDAAAPDNSARTMTRWTLLSSIGDFLAPLVVAAFVGMSLGWTELCWLAAACWLGSALLIAPLRFPARYPASELTEGVQETGAWASLREALRDPQLLRWAALSVIPTMLDEVFLGFVALYLRDILLVSEAGIALILTLQMLASFAGLFLLDWLLKGRGLRPVNLLTWLALGTLAGVLGLLVARTLWLVVVTLLVIGFSCAGWYPLAKAEAYARKPSKAGVVRTVVSLGMPFEMALPGVIGFISARFGVLTGLGVLGLAPLLVLSLLPYRQST